MKQPFSTRLNIRIALARHRLAQAELIGWPALAESFRRELGELLAMKQEAR